MLIDQMTEQFEHVYYDTDFLIMIESHLTQLRTDSEVKVETITKAQGYKYEGDFYGLLNELNIEKKYHFIILRFNGYNSSTDFRGDVSYILTPDYSEIDRLKNIFQTVS